MTEEKKAAAGSDEKPLDKMTVKDLREIAKDIPGVTGVSGMKKDELLAIVKEAKGVKEEKPVKKPVKKKKSKGKKTLTVKEMKQEIARLRQEKENTKDTQTRQRIRRRMNRLRKKTRRGVAA